MSLGLLNCLIDFQPTSLGQMAGRREALSARRNRACRTDLGFVVQHLDQVDGSGRTGQVCGVLHRDLYILSKSTTSNCTARPSSRFGVHLLLHIGVIPHPLLVLSDSTTGGHFGRPFSTLERQRSRRPRDFFSSSDHLSSVSSCRRPQKHR